ncbi:MAG: NAD-dependent epimerase/dehydratase family protein [Bdellovibrionota bacterium]
MIVFLTGTTSYLGEAVLRKLLSEGHKVRALLPPDEDVSHLSALQFERIPGTLSTIEAIRQGMPGAHVVFHLDQADQPCRKDKDAYYKANVIGTKNVLSLASRYKVDRVIVGGGVEVAGRLKTPYATTRAKGIEAAFKLNFEVFTKKMEVLALHPGVLVGPQDRRPSPFGKVLLDYLQGKLSWLPCGGVPLVDVEDAAQAVVLSADRGIPGSDYMLINEYVPLASVFSVLNGITGRKEGPRFLPGPVVKALSCLRAAPIPSNLVKLFTFSSRRLPDGLSDRQVLRLPPYRPLEESLARAVEWWVEAGMVTRQQAYY